MPTFDHPSDIESAASTGQNVVECDRCEDECRDAAQSNLGFHENAHDARNSVVLAVNAVLQPRKRCCWAAILAGFTHERRSFFSELKWNCRNLASSPKSHTRSVHESLKYVQPISRKIATGCVIVLDLKLKYRRFPNRNEIEHN